MNSQIWLPLAAALLLVVAAVLIIRRLRSSGKRMPISSSAREMGLASTGRHLRARLEAIFSGSGLTARTWQDLEAELLAADLGVEATGRIVEAVRRVDPSDPGEARAAMRSEMIRIVSGFDRGLRMVGDPSILVVVGVNGVGKTTTVAKLAAHLKSSGRSVLIGGADTFRPAADTQLKIWADRLGVPIVSGPAGGDPAAVAYDALQAARAKGSDSVIIDTAGRFQTSHNLMQELAKLVRVLGKDGDEISEVLLVLDATTGQSGLAQARRFSEVGVTGLILTKLDGTSKGGVVLGVESELSLPVKFIGVGERMEDLVPFDGPSFVDALLDPA